VYPFFLFKIPKFHIYYEKDQNGLFKLINKKTNKVYYFFNFKRITRYLVYDGFEGKGLSLAKDYQIYPNINIVPNDTVIEVGPNIGELTSYFVSKKAFVHLFEIDPLAIKCLKLNFNNSEIKLNEMGAWNVDGEVKIQFNSNEASTTLYIDRNDNSLNKIRTIKLSTYIQNMPNIKLLKIEAEGGEPEVLEGIQDCFNKIKYICLDCGPERNKATTIQQCKVYLESKNFKCNIEGNYLLAKNEN
jgi:FkbM family methyltransferase